MVLIINRETNRKAAEVYRYLNNTKPPNKSRKWTAVTVNEMYAFFWTSAGVTKSNNQNTVKLWQTE